jgi:NitT/TauT family transport system permease protein
MKKILSIFKRGYSPALLFIVWEFGARAGFIDQRFFPEPSRILINLSEQIFDPLFVRDILVSLGRLFCGILAGSVPAVMIGALMARSRGVHDFFHPLIMATYPIPKIAILPLIILLFGFGELSKFFIIATGTFFIMALNTQYGVSRIERKYLDVAKTLRLSRNDIWIHVLLPGALPAIFHGLKLSLGTGFMLLVAVEFIGSHSGIGHRVWSAWESFNIEALYGGLFTIAFLSLAIQKFLDRLESLALPWARTNRSDNL